MKKDTLLEVVSREDNLNLFPGFRERWPDMIKDTSSICFTVFSVMVGELSEDDRQFLQSHELVKDFDTYKRPVCIR